MSAPGRTRSTGCSPTGTTSNARRSNGRRSSTGSPGRCRRSATRRRSARRRRRSASTGPTSPARSRRSPRRRGELRDGDRRRATPTRNATSSATCSSPWSTSPAISTSIRNSRCAPRTDKFRSRFEGVEQLAAERASICASDLATLDALWDEVKAAGHVDGHVGAEAVEVGPRTHDGGEFGSRSRLRCNSSSVISHSERQRRQRRSMTSSNTVVARHVDNANTNAPGCRRRQRSEPQRSAAVIPNPSSVSCRPITTIAVDPIAARIDPRTRAPTPREGRRFAEPDRTRYPNGNHTSTDRDERRARPRRSRPP